MKSSVKPGLYHNVPFDVYRKWDAINNSSLDPIFESPAHYFAALAEPQKKTEALAFGNLAHTALLEPDDFRKNYIGVPENQFTKGCTTADGEPAAKPKATKQYKLNKIHWYLETPRLVLKPKQKEFAKLRDKMQLPEQIEWLHNNAKRTMIEFEAYSDIQLMCAAMKEHRNYEKLRNGKKEVSFVWLDDHTGLKCKGRVDSLTPYLFADFKTTLSTFEWEWSFWKWKYYRQAAFYQDGLSHFTNGELLPAWFAACMKSPPYDVCIAPVHDEDIQQGRSEYRDALNRIKLCRKLKAWPGVASPEHWRIPAQHRVYELVGNGQTQTVKG